MIEKTNTYIKSTNGINKLHVIIWKPEGQVRAILQIVHGMAEHIDRYDRFATYMAEHGILTIGNDHLGHGDSVAADEELGYFNTKKKSATVVKDLYKVTTVIRAKYPEAPFILMGHSMGSFLARRYMMTYGDRMDGAIIMGTGSQPPAVLLAAKAVAGMIGLVKGEKHRSRLLQKLSQGPYTKKIANVRTELDWLSCNSENVDRYIEDPKCGFNFTVNGYKTLFDMISYIQNPANIAKLPENLPVLLVSGEEDPVGDYGAAVKQICEDYKKAGMKKVQMKLYPEDRHEILNETDYMQVHEDLLAFVESVIADNE